MKMLKSAAIFGLVILSFIGLSLCENDGTSKNARIVIVGAGPSGIAAASKLFENGFTNVKILEAEDRIGGRVYTTKFGDYLVDLGGQWVHGHGDNVAFKLAEPLGLLEHTNKSNFALKEVFFDSSTNRVNENVAKKFWDFFVDNVYEPRFEDNVNYESFGDYVEKTFDEKFKDDPEMMENKKNFLNLLELLSMAGDAAESWFDVSARGVLEFSEYEGDRLTNWKEKGYSTILDILMKRYPNPEEELPVLNNTVLNAEVVSIDYSKDKTEGEAPITLTTTNGQVYEADHVIVTVSLGVLKDKHQTLFTPALSEEKISAIEGLGFGNVAKIYLMFEKPFWTIGDERILNFFFLWNDADRKVIEEDPEKKWILGINGAITVEHKPNLLTLWLSGKYARDMEAVPEDKVLKHSTEILHKFLDNEYNVTDPIAVLRTRWYSNPHFKGTYSYRSIESDKRKVYPNMLEKPVTPENLMVLFAGEATSEHRYATVDGAIGSGWKAANRLTDHYKQT